MLKTKEQNEVIILKEDYEQLRYYIGSASYVEGEMTLAHELKRATIVDKADFPSDRVRLDSKIAIQDTETKSIMEFTIVMPAHSDIKQKKVSVLTPMGTAFIGFKKGDEVQWKVPAGIKKFKIIEVYN